MYVCVCVAIDYNSFYHVGNVRILRGMIQVIDKFWQLLACEDTGVHDRYPKSTFRMHDDKTKNLRSSDLMSTWP